MTQCYACLHLLVRKSDATNFFVKMTRPIQRNMSLMGKQANVIPQTCNTSIFWRLNSSALTNFAGCRLVRQRVGLQPACCGPCRDHCTAMGGVDFLFSFRCRLDTELLPPAYLVVLFPTNIALGWVVRTNPGGKTDFCHSKFL